MYPRVREDDGENTASFLRKQESIPGAMNLRLRENGRNRCLLENGRDARTQTSFLRSLPST